MWSLLPMIDDIGIAADCYVRTGSTSSKWIYSRGLRKGFSMKASSGNVFLQELVSDAGYRADEGMAERECFMRLKDQLMRLTRPFSGRLFDGGA